VFRGESVLVTVDVYPQRDGKIVEGLKASDFEILEDGKPQTVETIEFVRIEPGTPESARKDPNNLKEMLELAGDPHNRVFVVFLDQLTSPSTVRTATRRRWWTRSIASSGRRSVRRDDAEHRSARADARPAACSASKSSCRSTGRGASATRSRTDRTDPMEEQLKSCFEYKPPTPQQAVRPGTSRTTASSGFCTRS
jgi:hypothetical protein